MKSCHWCDYIDTTIVSLHHGLYCHALYMPCMWACVCGFTPCRNHTIDFLLWNFAHLALICMALCMLFVFFSSVVLFFSYSLVVPCATPYSTFRRLRTMQSSIALSFFFYLFRIFFSFKVQSFTGGRNFFFNAIMLFNEFLCAPCPFRLFLPMWRFENDYVLF